MDCKRALRVATAVCLLLSGCTEASPAPDTAIVVQSDRSDLLPCDVGKAKEVQAVAAYPCRIVAVLRTSIRADRTGARPDPGSLAALSSAGTYFTSADRVPGALLMWDSSGAFVKAYESLGRGPGELSAAGSLVPLMGPSDSLWVLDASNRWTVFDPSLEYARQFTTEMAGRDRRSLGITASGEILLTAGQVYPDANVQGFRLYDRNGRPVRQFGPTLQENDRRVFAFPSALTHRSTFWTLPENGRRTGLVMSEWSMNGERLRTVEIHRDWLPLSGYKSENESSDPPLPEWEFMSVDSSGYIWVGYVARDDRHRGVQDGKSVDLGREYDGRLEVLDPAGRIVASFVYDGPHEPAPPVSAIFPGRRVGYRSIRDSLGLNTIEVYDLHLARRSP